MGGDTICDDANNNNLAEEESPCRPKLHHRDLWKDQIQSWVCRRWPVSFPTKNSSPRGQILDLPPCQYYTIPKKFFLDAQRSIWSSGQTVDHSDDHPEAPDNRLQKRLFHTVFWEFGGTNPAHSLRFLLLRAGIEPNPGPSCDWCDKPFRGDKCNKPAPRFHCGTAGCDKVCHKKEECSQFGRKARKTSQWFCSSHSRVPVIRTAPETAQPVQSIDTNKTPKEKCSNPGCKKNLKQNPLVCTVCSQKFCQKSFCSGLPNRYAVKRARTTWKCATCDPNKPDQEAAQESEPESSSHPDLPLCTVCKAMKVKPSHLTCKICGDKIHMGVNT